MTTRIAPGVGANLLGQHSAERNQDATTYVGNLDPQVRVPHNPSLLRSLDPADDKVIPKAHNYVCELVTLDE
jgi:splicing factor 3B subunit 4